MAVPFEFIIFGVTLIGVMLFHQRSLPIALGGFAALLAWKLFVVDDVNLTEHFLHEASLLVNLFGLLVGFEILADHFRESKLSHKVPAILPKGWLGAFALLGVIWVFSSVLDSIAAAMIGASIATTLFKGRVRTGYFAAIIAASNSGGAGSVIGDTTTTMLWMAGVPALDMARAYLPAFIALFVFGIPISIQQNRFHRIATDVVSNVPVDWTRIRIAACILVGFIVSNVTLEHPALGVWVAILIGARWRRPHWKHVPRAARGATFLLSLVASASLMPVASLPPTTVWTTFGLGWFAAFFDNIPLTKLAIDQGNYDWGLLSFVAGYCGSMTWFGSTAGVAVAADHPKIRETRVWFRETYWIPIAYVVAFGLTYLILGWHPTPIR